jgi:hypothetical protein
MAMTRVDKSARQMLADRAAGASMAEFGPVLVLFVLIIIVPVVNLLFFATGYACVAALSQSCATDAANAATFNEALVNVQKRARSIVDSGLGKFVKLQPLGGYAGCGVDLYIATTNVANPNNGHFYGPNTGLPAGAAANAAANIYQYTLRSSFAVGPCIALSHLPLVGDLPMVGRPATVEITTSRAAEHTDCLTAEGSCQSGVRH